MTFIWPHMLWLLALVPLLVAVYLLMLRRRRRFALRYANLAMVRQAMGPGPGFRRHVPPLLFLAALIATMVAVARPAAVVTLPHQRGVVMLAVDVSGSMRATDLEPNRLVVAQNAVREFVADQPRNVRIGVVAFAATAMVVQAPTLNRDDVIAAVDRLQTYPGTAVGRAILSALGAIFEGSDLDIGLDLEFGDQRSPFGRGMSLDQRDAAPPPARSLVDPAEPGSYTSAVVILLTDGETNAGPDPVEAARVAANLGVRVFTVALGTEEGEIIGFMGRSMRVRVDEASLREIARITGASHYSAGSETDLREVYQSLSTEFVLETEQTEITALFAAFAGLLALLSVLLSMLWFNRMV